MVLGSSRAKALGIAPQHLSISPLAHDPSYSKIEVHSECYWGSVCLITSVFEQGGITVLVGTKSLLGEGWDAPCINTLVLASFVDSFMLSNQMRGRAIRVDSTQPRKTANIWHLVCAEPGIFGPGDDYDLLVRRCAAFVGVSAAAPVIEKGTEEQSIFLRALRETLSPIDNPSICWPVGRFGGSSARTISPCRMSWHAKKSLPNSSRNAGRGLLVRCSLSSHEHLKAGGSCFELATTPCLEPLRNELSE